MQTQSSSQLKQASALRLNSAGAKNMGMMLQGAKWDKHGESGCDKRQEATRQPMTSRQSHCPQLQTVLSLSRQRAPPARVLTDREDPGWQTEGVSWRFPEAGECPCPQPHESVKVNNKQTLNFNGVRSWKSKLSGTRHSTTLYGAQRKRCTLNPRKKVMLPYYLSRRKKRPLPGNNSANERLSNLSQ